MNYKIKEKLQIFAGVGIISIGAISLFILFTTEDELLPYQGLWEFVFGLMLTLPFFIFYHLDKHNLKLADKEYENSRKSNKRKAKKIRVDLTKCNIECDSSYERIESNNPSNIRDPWEGIKPSKNLVKNIQHSECVIVYEMEYQGKKVRFESEIIFKDKITLSFMLEHEKETDLYVKPNGKYFFDLDFLLEPHEQ